MSDLEIKYKFLLDLVAANMCPSDFRMVCACRDDASMCWKCWEDAMIERLKVRG